MAIQQNIILNLLESIIKAILTFFQEISDPINFIDKYFISALYEEYNFYNTVVYTILGILSIYLIGKVIIRLNQKGTERWGEEFFIPVHMDKEFFVAVLPYIFIGSTIRALQDIAHQGKIISPYEIFSLDIFITPYVYVINISLTLLIGIISIFITQEYLKNVQHFSNWRNTFLTVGIIIEIILIIPIIFLLNDPYYIGGGIIILFLTGIFGILFIVITAFFSRRYFPDKKLQMEEITAMVTQMFDAFNTVIALEFYYYQEQHYLPSFLFNTPWGAWPFLIIKFGVVLLFIYAVRGIENKEVSKWLLWVVFMLGLATGTRDFLRLMTNT
ncbi:MAG: DUF63 family protein [Candidatus Hodarchaeales archaeon]|jgi:uncharacterized membrane protein